jgi:hypothetical protein
LPFKCNLQRYIVAKASTGKLLLPWEMKLLKEATEAELGSGGTIENIVVGLCRFNQVDP